MLRTGGDMELLLIQKLEELGLMFGYPDEAPDRTPLEVDTDTLYSNILQSLTDAGATEETFDEVFDADADEYAAQVDALISANSVEG
jgi:predicted metalloendopeptidase